MATVTAFADSSPTTVTGTWSTTGNLTADDGTFTTTTPAKSGESTLDANGFDFSAIDAAATINSVTITAGGSVSSTSSIDTIGVRAYDGATAIGTEGTSTTWTTSDGNVVTAGGTAPTLSQLLSANFKVRIRAARGNTNTTYIANFDFVKVVVDYTNPPPGSISRLQALSWNGAWLTTQDLVTGSCTAGSLLVLCVGTTTPNPSPVGTITDDKSNTWQRADVSFNTRSVEIFYAENCASGVTTITVPTPGVWVGRHYTFQEFSNVATSSALDVADAHASPTDDPHVTPSISNTVADAVAVVCDVTDNETSVFTGDASYTGSIVNTTSGTGTSIISQYKILSATGSQSASFDVVTACEAAAAIAIFKKASTGGSTGKAKVWSGSAWVEKPAKVWSGSAWVEKPIKVWNGSAWVLA